MMNMHDFQNSFAYRLNVKFQAVMKFILAILVAAFITIVFAQTIFRHCFHASIWWSEELSRFLFVWTIMLGVNVAITEKQMLRLEFVETLFSKRTAAVVDIIVSVLAWFFIAALLYSSGLYFRALGTKQLAPTLRWQMRYVTLCMPISAVLMLWTQSLSLVEKVIYLKECAKEELE